MNPIDLLPIQRPLDTEGNPMDFYKNVVHPLIPDVIKLMLTGIPIDLSKVKDVEDTVSKVIDNCTRIFAENPKMQAFLEARAEGKRLDSRDKMLAKFKTANDCMPEFNWKNTKHRLYVINVWLDKHGHERESEATVKTIRNLANIYGSNFLENFASGRVIKQEYVDSAMTILGEEKARLYNQNLKLKEDMKPKVIEPFNPSSPLQKKEFFDYYGIKSTQKTEKGADQWNRAELEKIDTTDEDLKQCIQAMIDYSFANIIKSNFIEAFYEYTHNGRLHGTLKLFGAKSFRMTSQNPNLLNFPSTGSLYAKPIKRCFVAEPGKIIYQADLSALEDRVAANLSRDRNKCSIFTEGLDGHCLNSYYYFKEEIEKELPRRENEPLNEYIMRYKEATDTNKVLKGIRQKSKSCTFGMNYGAYPPKIARSMGCSLKEAEQIFQRYHEELYPGVDDMRTKVEKKAKKEGKVHLGLGCYMKSSNPGRDIRTLFNACSQFWSILTLLTINKLNTEIQEAGYENKVEVISTIYDSIYVHLDNDPLLIKWLNDRIIPLMTRDFLQDTIVHNEAEGEIGYNFCDTVKIANNASITEISKALEELDGTYEHI